MDDLWAIADGMRRTEVRLPCPYCAKRKNDKTLCLNTVKRVGACKRCGWSLNGKPPEHFSESLVNDLEDERRKRQWKFDEIKSKCGTVTRDCAASIYLWRRLGTMPDLMPKLGYIPSWRLYDSGEYYETPAMVGALQDATGRVTGWHLTHLNSKGEKFQRDCRRYHKLHPLNGSAIRLYPATETLIVCEGIETALGIRMITADPVWACGDAGKLSEFAPPEGIKRLLIAGDNDASGVGQQAAWTLFDRFKDRMSCAVKIPEKENTDWLDQLRGSDG